jgi:hypothetical protein
VDREEEWFSFRAAQILLIFSGRNGFRPKVAYQFRPLTPMRLLNRTMYVMANSVSPAHYHMPLYSCNARDLPWTPRLLSEDTMGIHLVDAKAEDK